MYLFMAHGAHIAQFLIRLLYIVSQQILRNSWQQINLVTFRENYFPSFVELGNFSRVFFNSVSKYELPESLVYNEFEMKKYQSSNMIFGGNLEIHSRKKPKKMRRKKVSNNLISMKDGEVQFNQIYLCFVFQQPVSHDFR